VRLRAGHEYVSGLYQLSRDERYRNVAGELALSWLKKYPDAKPTVQRELMEAAQRFGSRDDIRSLARERVATTVSSETKAIWMGALLVVDFDQSETEIAAYCAEDAAHIWPLRGAIRTERGERWLPLTVRQLEFLATAFAEAWPPIGHPMGGWTGDNNPWDASEFIGAVIDSIGASNTKDASDALDRLSADHRTAAYRDRIKHIRASQQKLRRDTDYASGDRLRERCSGPQYRKSNKFS
jgi:hypothetical protein